MSGSGAMRKMTRFERSSLDEQYENASEAAAGKLSLLKNVPTPKSPSAMFSEIGVRSGARKPSFVVVPACATEYLPMKVRYCSRVGRIGRALNLNGPSIRSGLSGNSGHERWAL